MYQRHLAGFSAPPVALTIPPQSSFATCTLPRNASSDISSLKLWSRSESSTYSRAASLNRSPVHALIISAPWPNVLYAFIMRVLWDVNDGGAAVLPWPIPIDGSAVVPPKGVSLWPNVVRRCQLIFWITVSIIATISTRTLKLCKAMLAIVWVTESKQSAKSAPTTAAVLCWVREISQNRTDARTPWLAWEPFFANCSGGMISASKALSIICLANTYLLR